MNSECILVRSKTQARRKVERSLGYLDEGKMYCHHCDNPKCINEEHIFVGTNSDNMMDCADKEKLPIAGWNIGISPSKETKERISEGIATRWQDPQYRENVAEGLRKSRLRPAIMYKNGKAIL